MLALLRSIVVVVYSILVCVLGCIYCLFSPRNPRHVATFGHLFGRLAPVFGLKVELRKPAGLKTTRMRFISATTRIIMTWSPPLPLCSQPP